MKQHNDYLLPYGREFYNKARQADRLDKCLYWLDRYNDINRRIVIRKYKEIAKQKRHWNKLQRKKQ